MTDAPFTETHCTTSRYWQHQTPLRCPKHKRQQMGWLGLGYWICSTCKAIYVQMKDGHGQWEVDDPREAR